MQSPIKPIVCNVCIKDSANVVRDVVSFAIFMAGFESKLI